MLPLKCPPPPDVNIDDDRTGSKALRGSQSPFWLPDAFTDGREARWGGQQLFCAPGANHGGQGAHPGGVPSAAKQQQQLLSSWSSAASTLQAAKGGKGGGGAGWSRANLGVVAVAATVAQRQPRSLASVVSTGPSIHERLYEWLY